MPVHITTLSENTASRTKLLAEWGLSIMVEADRHTVLLDTGASVSAAVNALALGVDLSRIEAIALSHGHFDHTGGLLHILRLMRRPVEVIAHPELWAAKYGRLPGEPEQYAGVPFPREAAESAGARFKLTREPVWITENIVTSGEVPMVTDYEAVDPILYVKKDAALLPDPMEDDLALFVKSEKGLVVVLGCAHRGIINTIEHARTITGVDTVYAVIGGTHLHRVSAHRLESTIAALSKLGVKRLGVSHCTGLEKAAILAHHFGEAFFFNNAGTSITL